MRLAADILFPYAGPAGSRARCRVRVYEPDVPRLDAPVVVCSELRGLDPGATVAKAASTIAARVAAAFRLHREPVWIEHRPPSGAGPETFELVTFGTFRAEEIRRMGPRVLWDLEVDGPERKPLDRATVEALVGREV